MKIKNSSKIEAVLSEIGARLTQRRLESKLTQAALAKKADVSKRTVERIEAGNSVQLATMIQVLRVFRLLEPFGLSLESKQKTRPTTKKPTSVKKEGSASPEITNKSHSWGY